MRKRTTPAIGDVFEVATGRGFAYFQLSHLTPVDNLPLIRVLPGLYESRPATFEQIVRQRELYFTFYVLPVALGQGQITHVSNEPIPTWARDFPPMRRRWGAGRDGTFSWLIGPASNSGTPESLRNMQRVEQLSAEQKKLSIDEICSHEALIGKILSGWTPECDEELQHVELLSRQHHASKTGDSGTPLRVRYYLYFQREDSAQAASAALERQDKWDLARRKLKKGEWLLVAAISVYDRAERDRNDEFVEQIARRFDGILDGSEIEVNDA